MALSVKEADEHLIHEIGGPLVGISNQRILDEAGQKLYQQADWSFLKRPARLLDLTNGQSFILLPADFGSIQSINFSASTYLSVNGTTMNEIARMREIGFPWDGCLYYSHDFAVDATTGVASPRLEIYPTPTVTQVGALTLYYRAGWEKVVVQGDGSNTYIRGLPEYLEGIYVNFVRACARGRQTGAMGACIAAVVRSDDFQAALRYDRALQWENGPMTGGGLECADVYDGRPWYLKNMPAGPSV